MADENIQFKLDLDADSFIDALKGAKEGISSLASIGGHGGELTELVASLGEVATVAGVIGTSFLALKTVMNTVFEGENIKAINKQFEILAHNAGVAGEEMKEALAKASHGLIDDTDLLASASKGFVELGANANRMAEIMEVARKTTAVFGGDLKDNFEQLTSAISRGNERLLAMKGIHVDMKKALISYARAHGVLVDQLDEEQKRTVFLNTALEAAKNSYKGVSGDIKQATNAWTELKIAVHELGEVFTIVFTNTIGPILATALKGIAAFAHESKNLLQSAFGDGAEKNAAKLEVYQTRLKSLQGALDELNTKGKAFYQGTLIEKGTAIGDAKIQEIKEQIKSINAEMAPVQAKAEAALSDAKKAAAEIKKQADLTAKNKLAQEQAKQEVALAKSMNEMKLKRLEIEMQLAESEEQVNKISVERQKTMIALIKAENQELIQKEQKGLITAKQRDAQIAHNDAMLKMKLKQNEDALLKERERALDRYLKKSQNVAQGITRAFAVGSAKNKALLKDFGHTGQVVFDSFGKAATNAFVQIGKGAQDGTEVMKKAFFGMLGEIAIEQGSVMLLSGIWPPNPPAIAAGAALLVLGGMLEGMSGGGGGGATAGGGFGGADISPSYASNTTTDTSLQNAQQSYQKSVSVQIQGNYYDTEDTRRQMLEMIRRESDATDFKYSFIPGK